VLADQDYLARILDNLVSNAIKFSHPNTSVTVSLNKKDTGKVQLAVKDEGQGIREDEMKKLFGKFSRLSARPTAKESSTGLGLYIVKSLVEELEGSIWCESVWEHGTTFFVELPVAPK
jgi:signal transduction histidine kinase